MKSTILSCILLIFISIQFYLCKAKNESQKKVETDEYEQQKCSIIDNCRECSYLELKQIQECKQNSFIQIQRCQFKNIKNENDMYEEDQYLTCADKDIVYIKNIHYFFAFIAIGFFISMYKLNSKKYEIENQWFSSLKK